MEIKTAEKRDLDGIMEIERSSFSVPWSENSMLYEIESEDGVALVAKDGNTVAGFVILRLFDDEAEIFNIAVRENTRRQGIGFSLMQSVIDEARKKSVNVLYLEVRESNTGAYDLYCKCGFEKLSVRKNYYDAPKENAIIMACDLRRGNEK